MRLIVLLVLLAGVINCSPAIKVYGPVKDPCNIPADQPKVKVASLGEISLGEMR